MRKNKANRRQQPISHPPETPLDHWTRVWRTHWLARWREGYCERELEQWALENYVESLLAGVGGDMARYRLIRSVVKAVFRAFIIIPDQGNSVPKSPPAVADPYAVADLLLASRRYKKPPRPRATSRGWYPPENTS